MTIETLSVTERETDEALDVAIDRCIARLNEAITQINTNTTGLATINTMLDGLADPVTISISTLTQAAVNAAFVTDLEQKKTLIAALKA